MISRGSTTRKPLIYQYRQFGASSRRELASKRAKPSYRQVTIDHGTVADCLAVLGIDRTAGLPTTRELPINKGLHSGQFLLGVKAHFYPPKPQKMLVAGVVTLILLPAMVPWM
jgi:hypothetical protein